MKLITLSKMATSVDWRATGTFIQVLNYAHAFKKIQHGVTRSKAENRPAAIFLGENKHLLNVSEVLTGGIHCNGMDQVLPCSALLPSLAALGAK